IDIEEDVGTDSLLVTDVFIGREDHTIFPHSSDWLYGASRISIESGEVQGSVLDKSAVAQLVVVSHLRIQLWVTLSDLLLVRSCLNIRIEESQRRTLNSSVVSSLDQVTVA